MSAGSLKGLRVAVAGAGVLGLSTAGLAARRGAEVVVFDPAASGDNASGVAAGMLSPALEAALEGGDPARHALFQRAYEAWPAFAAEVGLPPPRAAGAIRLGTTAALDVLAGRLRALGVDPRRLGAAEVRRRQPLYGGGEAGLFVPQDGRLDPVAGLDALARALASKGSRRVCERLTPGAPPPAGFDRLVIATGDDARAWIDAAPELARLTPIKGHILHYAAAGCGGPTLRGEGGYLAPQAHHIAFGATMEAGRADRAVDPAVAAGLHACAVALAPKLAGVPWLARTGVRVATPDGLPLVGGSVGGFVVATGGRRNGWLLAPLVAEAAVAALAGAPSQVEFDPRRFDSDRA